MAGWRVFVLVLILSLACMSLLPAAEATGTYSVTTYPLPAGSTGPSAMTIDAAGDVWLIQDSPPVLWRFSRENGSFTGYSLKGFENAGFAGVSVDSEGRIWFADLKGNRVGAYSPQDNQTSTFDFPGPMAPSSVLRAGDTLWIGCKEEVGELNLATGEFNDHFVYNMDSYLRDIQFDPAGNIWFTESRANKIGVYFWQYDKTSEFPIPSENSDPQSGSLDSSGRLWFVEAGTNRPGSFDTGQFTFTEYDTTAVNGLLPALSHLTTAGDEVWITDSANGRVLRFYPGEGRYASAELGNGTVPRLLKADSDGILWVYEAGGKQLAEVRIGEGFGVPTPTPAAAPTATPQPTAMPTATPVPAAGFQFVIASSALVAGLGLKKLKK